MYLNSVTKKKNNHCGEYLGGTRTCTLVRAHCHDASKPSVHPRLRVLKKKKCFQVHVSSFEKGWPASVQCAVCFDCVHGTWRCTWSIVGMNKRKNVRDPLHSIFFFLQPVSQLVAKNYTRMVLPNKVQSDDVFFLKKTVYWDIVGIREARMNVPETQCWADAGIGLSTAAVRVPRTSGKMCSRQLPTVLHSTYIHEHGQEQQSASTTTTTTNYYYPELSALLGSPHSTCSHMETSRKKKNSFGPLHTWWLAQMDVHVAKK